MPKYNSKPPHAQSRTKSHTQAHHTRKPPRAQKTLRVIGGKHKGLKLYAPKVARPSKAILKESCFDTLGSYIIDMHFIEAFSGSGSMGIEALSRGAKKAVFFEQDKEALEILRQNLALISKHIDKHAPKQNPPKSQNYQIIQGDSLQNLPTFLAALTDSSILYIDPPFFIRQNYADIYEKCANIIAHIHSRALGLIIIEHSSLYAFKECLGCFSQVRTKRFGKSSLTYFAPKELC